MEFKPIDKKDYEDIELWTMTSGFHLKTILIVWMKMSSLIYILAMIIQII